MHHKSDTATAGDAWSLLRPLAQARLSLQQSSPAAMPIGTGVRLSFWAQHHLEIASQSLDIQELLFQIEADGWETLVLDTLACDRETAISQPSKSDTLAEASEQLLQSMPAKPNVYVTIAIEEGHAASAVTQQAISMMHAIRESTLTRKVVFTPVAIISNGSLPLAVRVGEHWDVNWVIVLRGQKPEGQGSATLGVYLYDMVFGDGLQETYSVPNVKAAYQQTGHAVSEWLWREEARTGQVLFG
jgi:ethanolamine ammonia-lyase small subunit